jgi:hypothetical protein
LQRSGGPDLGRGSGPTRLIASESLAQAGVERSSRSSSEMPEPVGSPSQSLGEFIVARVEGSIADEGITGLLGQVVGSSSRDIPPWLFVTDLVNPAAAYWRRVSPAIPTDPSIVQKLRFGKVIHAAAESWFRQVEGFAASEGVVDGAHSGMVGVRGRIDFRVADSIVELKTTDRATVGVEDLFTVCPQDLEQLVIYALFTHREGEVHWLVYYRATVDPPFVAFKVRITHPGPMRHLFEQRINLWNQCITARSPERLGRCRYFAPGCDYNLQHVCGCHALDTISVQTLRQSVEVSQDFQFENRLEEARQTARRRGPTGLTVWDLHVPRQAYLKNVGLGVPYFEEDEERNAAWRLLHDALRASALGLTTAALELDGISLGRSESINFEETTRQGRVRNTYPILVKASTAAAPFRADRLPPAYASQLGVLCALDQSDVGLLFVAYASRPGLFGCYRVRYRDVEGIRAEVRRTLRDVSWATSHHDPSALPICDSWLTATCSAACLCREAEQGTSRSEGS